MVKNRMSVVDVRAAIAELNATVVGLRLANFYDINTKTFLLKFAKPDNKVYVLIESGIRLHTTEFERDKSKMPNSFSLKIRKHIRTRRVESVEQIGVDRVVDINFGGYHLIAEFYAKGNMVLTDNEYKIIALLRAHKHEEDVRFAVGEYYPIEKRKQFSKISIQSLTQAIRDCIQSDPSMTLKQALAAKFDYGTGFVEHCILGANLKPNSKITSLQLENGAEASPEISQLAKIFKEADDFIEKSSTMKHKGYIILNNIKKTSNESKLSSSTSSNKSLSIDNINIKKTINSSDSSEMDSTKKSNALSKTTTTTTTNETNDSTSTPSDLNAAEEEEKRNKEKEELRKRYDDFTPFLFNQFKNKEYIEFDNFDSCVDEFFSALESQKLENQKANIEKNVGKKLEKLKKETVQRIEELKHTEHDHTAKAQLIETNLEDVDECIQIIASAVAQAIPWEEIKQVINERKSEGDPLANMIARLKLETNQITLILSSELHPESVKVDVDITLTAYANAQQYYQSRKKINEKFNKTVEMSEKAFKAAEKKSQDSLKKKQITSDIHLMRKRFWFEKFYWFITSENYLVLSGRDAQQNEMLVKRYMKKGDVYLHADIHGASSCIIKNPSGEAIPPLSLAEAGGMTVCRSAAWDAKILTSAWWVYDHQVSKTAPTGEYLVTGSFMIRGKKHFLPPNQLVMGIGILFKVDESCLGNHIGERKSRSGTNVQEEQDVDEEDVETHFKKPAKYEEARKTQTRMEKKNVDPDTILNIPSAGEKYSLEDPSEDLQQDPNNEETSKHGDDDDDDDDDNDDNEGGDLEDRPKEKKGGGFSQKDKKKLKKLLQQGMEMEAAKQLIMDEKKKVQEMKQQCDQDAKKEKREQEESEKKVQTPSKKKKKGKKKRKGDSDDSLDEEEKQLRAELTGQISKKTKKKNKNQTDSNQQNDDRRKEQQNSKKKKQQASSITTILTMDDDQGEYTITSPATEGAAISSKKLEEEEIKALLAEENIQFVSEEDKQKLTEIDSLTSIPLPEDVILFALPVCAPYGTLKSYRYKIKLVPGSGKRGKAGQQAMNILLNEAKHQSDKEHAVMKQISETDVSSSMIGNVRIATAITKSKKKK